MSEDITGQAAAWVQGRLPDDWFTGPARVTVDREEITIVGTLAFPDGVPGDDTQATQATQAAQAAETTEAARGRLSRFREDTREQRIAIAREAEHRFDRKVAWGASCGPVETVWTHLAVPVMTRLRQPQRRTLDTLVEAGVARSRADALAWCVRLVGQHTEDWLAELREAMTSVQQVRDRGPQA